ncbi:hypothetical protein [Streptomyces sp. NPDC060194]|uniref:hypothetical protein n=1 Tax=Streptomyces sp. NPDC060194 TaxID=3347069 RepID=UPI00364E1C3F
MLALRLARGSRPLVQLGRIAVAATAGGVAFLLLSTLTLALKDPAGAFLRLVWCVPPLAATVYFAIAVARTDPATRPSGGLSSLGVGPARRALIAAASTVLACAAGSLAALLLFWHLRGDAGGLLPFAGAARGLLAADRELPTAAVVTLLAVVPLVAGAAGALALRPRAETDAEPGRALPWGVALTAVGLAVEAYASRGAPGAALPMPARFEGGSAGVVAGWALTAAGLVLSGPGLTDLCGRLLQAVRPGAVRLLAGRILRTEAGRIGRPLGVASAVASGLIAAGAVQGGPPGPLTVLGGVLVVGCTAATLVAAAVAARAARAEDTAALLRMGAPMRTLRLAALLRATALLAVFGPLTWAVGMLAALPLTD